ncbi:MAG: ABC transporter permease subunit [Planctomycetota bacterium]|nr:ABC transporter permease subunit [Planctomycetota bacterium]
MGGAFSNPVVVHEMRKSASTFGHYARRGIVVALIAIAAAVAWERRKGTMSAVEASMLGRELFQALFTVAWYSTFLLLPILTSGLIAREVERKTLEVLFATPLKDRQIVAGKFFVQYFYFLHMLLLVSPVFVVTMMLGGVDLDEVSYALAALLSFGFFCGAATLYLSTLLRRGTMAAVWFCVGLVLYGEVHTQLWSELREGASWPGMRELLLHTDPVQGLLAFVQSPPVKQSQVFCTACGELVLLGALALWLTVRRVRRLRARGVSMDGAASASAGKRRANRDEDPHEPRLEAGSSLDGHTTVTCDGNARGADSAMTVDDGGPAERARTKRRYAESAESLAPVWENPVSWKEVVFLNARKGRRLAWILALTYVVILCFPLWRNILKPMGREDTGVGYLWLAIAGVGFVTVRKSRRLMFVLVMLSLLVLFAVSLVLSGLSSGNTLWPALSSSTTVGVGLVWLMTASLAAGSVAREREDKTLDLLVVAPIGTWALLRGKARGVLSAIRPLAIVVMVVFALGLIPVLQAERLDIALYLTLVIVHFWLVALAVGFACSCLCSTVGRAMVTAVGILVAVGVVVPYFGQVLLPREWYRGVVRVSPYTHIYSLRGYEYTWWSRWGTSDYGDSLTTYFWVTTVPVLIGFLFAVRNLARDASRSERECRL